jgi:DNA polymerase I-like protein with 3'-5' exonuclease and polymerase domains
MCIRDRFCWASGKACYVRWMDDKGNYAFDISYKDAGAILSEWLDRDDVKYIGHHFAADAPWLHHVLGLNWYEKCIFDTEFAQQTANEAEDLSLERIAMKYTDLGRYDLDLVLWVKQNKALMEDGGYGAIPDEILIPYACKDVDTVFRAWPFIYRSLQVQDLVEYYDNIFHPFVTDVFVSFALVGLPMDVDTMDELRVLYTFARDKMEVILREEIHVEAKNFVLMAFATRLPPEIAYEKYLEFISLIANSDHAEAWSILKGAAKKPDDVPKLKSIFDHFIDSAHFNIRSAAHLKRWLFNVKGYEPIKSTSNKEKGLPSTSWEKIKGMPLDAQKNYNPAVDKQTLQILSEKNNDRILRKLLQLNAVGNICKAFLKEADVDADGNLVKENGLHFYLCSDNCVHGQMSTTETGRPRSWKPNSLNWPSYVNSMISNGISDLFGKLKERGELPAEFEKFIVKDDKGEYKSKVPSIRSCVKAPEGWCFVESDYQTAEIRGLAFISGDKSLIDIVCNPDLNFAVTKDDKKVRLSFPAEVFPPSVQEEYKHLLVSPDDPSLIIKDDGSLKHPKQDLHWSLAEMVHIKPREVLDEKKDRGAAKVGNFSSAYGASASTLERKIEQDTGKKPEEGTGQRLLKALEKRQPVAQDFLIKMERVPEKPGYYRAASGRLRHFSSHDPKYLDDIDEHLTMGLFKSMGREARNFPMQESVAATAARAGKWLLDTYIKLNMKARPLIILYDSVVTLCPLEERFKVAQMHQLFMTDENTWEYHGRKMNYPIDQLFCYRWSAKPSKDETKLLEDPKWRT